MPGAPVALHFCPTRMRPSLYTYPNNVTTGDHLIEVKFSKDKIPGSPTRHNPDTSLNAGRLTCNSRWTGPAVTPVGHPALTPGRSRGTVLLDRRPSVPRRAKLDPRPWGPRQITGPSYRPAAVGPSADHRAKLDPRPGGPRGTATPSYTGGLAALGTRHAKLHRWPGGPRQFYKFPRVCMGGSWQRLTVNSAGPITLNDFRKLKGKLVLDRRDRAQKCESSAKGASNVGGISENEAAGGFFPRDLSRKSRYKLSCRGGHRPTMTSDLSKQPADIWREITDTEAAAGFK
ncbi:hypothetical protein Bbelb_329340 [Branchiostoma belcheri]|nr:hypothetical protein Bbelb_329340 [Branchiostoma belcheri]